MSTPDPQPIPTEPRSKYYDPVTGAPLTLDEAAASTPVQTTANYPAGSALANPGFG